jgi:hypothetical protein
MDRPCKALAVKGTVFSVPPWMTPIIRPELFEETSLSNFPPTDPPEAA